MLRHPYSPAGDWAIWQLSLAPAGASWRGGAEERSRHMTRAKSLGLPFHQKYCACKSWPDRHYWAVKSDMSLSSPMRYNYTLRMEPWNATRERMIGPTSVQIRMYQGRMKRISFKTLDGRTGRFFVPFFSSDTSVFCRHSFFTIPTQRSVHSHTFQAARSQDRKIANRKTAQAHALHAGW